MMNTRISQKGELNRGGGGEGEILINAFSFFTLCIVRVKKNGASG